MALILEIEHLLGVAFAAIGRDSPEPDWPPQPDRVFSALVASWAARGKRSDEKAALEWLETLEPPRIFASAAARRPAPTSFVPPNDKVQVTSSPAWRSRQPRRFPASLPDDPTVCLVWSEDAGDAPLRELDALARDVACVGHSASLTRCRFFRADPPAADRMQWARRRVYRGRLHQLEVSFCAGRRPPPGESVRPTLPPTPTSSNQFWTEWLTLEIIDGTLDLRAAPIAAKTLRDAVMSGYGRAGLPVPEWISGHQAGGSPSRAPHLAVAPLANLGWHFSDGQLMGFALIPPARHKSFQDDADFRKALFRISERLNDRYVVELGKLEGAPNGLCLKLSLTLDSDLASLNPARYLKKSRIWATATPLVLPLHPKRGSVEEIEALIADACEHAGVSRPSRAVAHQHSMISAAPSAQPSRRSPRWTGWRVPESFRSRPLTHAVLEFDEPVTGPVLIGAGRFCGLGLCLPLDGELSE